MAWTSPRTWITGEVVTAAVMNAHVRDNLLAGFPDAVTSTSWTPALEATTTNPTTGTTIGRRWRVGPLQFVWVRFIITEGGGSGTYFVTLPAAASGLTASTANDGHVIGSWFASDASAPGANADGLVMLATSTTVRFHRISSKVNDTAPFTWTLNDVLTFHAVYPVA